jgi:tripeptidyl-peptidase-1
LTPVLRKHKKAKRASHLAHSDPILEGVSFEEAKYSIPAKAMSLSADLQGCGYNMTPTCIKALYGIPKATKASKKNSLGLYEQGDYFAKSDLDLFFKAHAPWVPQGTYPIPALIDGANFSVPSYSSLNTGESNIDIDLA